MKNLKTSILQKRKETYLKLQDRFIKSLKKGDFQSKNGRSKNHWITQLKKLERQLGVSSNLKLKHWALAFALGFVAIAGNAQEKPTQEKRFGSFFEQKREIRKLQKTNKGSSSSGRSEAVSIFSEQPVLGDGLLSDNKYVGDFDKDGDEDLIVFGYSSAAKMFVNDGVGDITTQNEIWTPSYGVDHILMGDFDGDADLDFVVLEENNSDQSRFVYLINDGNGNFTATNSAFGNEQKTLDVGDFDGDGDLDILTKENIGEYVNETKILSNTGSGTSFTAGVALSFLPSNTDNIHVGEFTGDVFPDITLIDQDTIKVYVNDGSGGFSAPSVVKTIISGANYNFVQLAGAGDTDADSDIDLIASITDNLWHFENDGAGNFTQSTIEQNVDDNLRINYDDEVTITNLNGNNGSEIIINGSEIIIEKDVQDIVSNTDSDETMIWINDGANVFTKIAQALNFTNNPSDDVYFTPMDYDGDGDNDLLLSSYVDMELFNNDGTANFTSFDDQIVDVVYSPDFDLLDLDGDSDLDVIMSFTNQTLINDGTGNFSKGQELSVTHETYYITTGDYDNDGDSDVIFTNEDVENEFTVWNNNGSGNFTIGSTFTATDTDDRIQAIATGDMNGDGAYDVVTVTSNDVTSVDNINIWTNNGSGVFTESSTAATNKIRGLVLADIDGDSDLDVITRAEMSYTSVGLATYTNTVGSLSADQLLTPMDPNFEFDEGSFSAGDIDGDADIDIVAIDDFDNYPVEIQLFTNDGSGTFTDTVLGTGSAEGTPIIEDFDLDGDMDFFIAGEEYLDELWTNDGVGVFSLAGKLDSKSYGAVTGDIDGDGDKDLFTLQYYQGNRFIINNTNMPVASIEADSLQLVTVYNETGGDGWTNNSNWKTGDVSSWFGVTVTDNRVTSLVLENNNVTGAFSVNSGLDSLTILDLSGNLLTGIPDLSASTVTTIDVSDNQLEFGSLEVNAAIPGIDYSNQGTIGTASAPAALAGDDFVLSITTSGTANDYQWFKDGTPISGAISDTHTLNTIDITDQADYHCEVTNGLVSGLTLTSEITSLTIQSVLELDSTQLVALYDETGGDNWTDNTNWKTGDVSTWFGVTVTNDRVSSLLLENNNLTGAITDKTDLDSLFTLDVSGNFITSIPDLSTTSITTLDVSNNQLDFGSLEMNTVISGIDYSNQANIGVAGTETVPAGTDLPVSITTGGSANLYQWFKDGVAISGATNSSYTVASINTAEMGDYHCQVTNTIATGLTLTTEPTTIQAQASISGTVFLDGTTALNNGDVTLLRITNSDGYDTTSVVKVASDGTYTHTNAILGDYISVAQADIAAFPNHLPTYWGEVTHSILWEDASTISLDSITTGLDVILEGVPEEKPVGEGLIAGIVEEEIPEGGRLEAKRRVGGAGVSVRRRQREGRVQDDILELVAYVYTNEEGEFIFENLEEDVYTFNVQYPGFPMDENSDLEIDVNNNQPEAQVTATVADGVISVAIINITGLISEKDYINVELYPNPTGEHLFINKLSTLDNNYKVSIFNSIGKKVLEEDYDIAQNKGISVNHLEAGVYIVHLQNPAKERRILKSFKVIIEK